ncbi:SPOR domain-containing protein [Ponticoccus litoralis]|uniref:SPOR domain-containing protein n=1 Tax=Ponticoccus litoralis TaxID=422297 RepID=A0AAW9SIA7_9RHOB
MKLSSMKLTALVVSFFALSAGAATAQGMDATPANFPPAGFKGTQFADARGCVFVRAGFDGNVTWVPRVTRQRKHICGQTPTSFGGATRTAAAPAPQERPVQITVTTPPAATPAAPAPTARATAPARVAAPAPARAAPATAPVRVAPAPARVATTTRVVRQPAPQPAPAPQQVVRVPASKPVAAEPPRVVRRVPAATAQPGSLKTYRVGTTVKVPAQIACQNGQTTRVVDGRRVALRCGPQATPHVTTIRRGEAPAPGKTVHYNRGSWDDSSLRDLPGDTRIVPRHVYESRDVSDNVVPAGYRPAWEDGRLNPYRAYMTLDGYDATQKLWTHTVPRRLIKRVGGYEHRDPILAYRVQDSSYPATSGQYGHRSTVSYHAQGEAYRSPVMSTRGAAPVATASDRWVEIGAFTSASGAQEAAARLTAAGLPVKMARLTQGGQVMRSVRVGPFASGAALNDALSAVRRTGYTQAYLR